MKRSIARAALAGTAIALLTAGPASAAPDRTFKLNPTGVQTSTWTSAPNVGVAPTAEVAAALDCDARMCDDTLIETTEIGRIKADILGVEPTLVDVDLYVFRSNAAGAALTELGRVTDFDADETFTTASKQPAGFYLVRADWSLGAGSVNGKVTFTPQPPVTASKI